MLELKNICVSFRSERQDKVFGHTRQQVLFDVSLNVKRGTCLGILGESGSGKSTMGRVLCGLLKPDSGEAILDGVSVYASRAGRRNLQNKLSVVFQDYTTSANPRFRVKDIIGEGLTVRERREGGRLERKKEMAALLELVGLPADFAGRFPHELSGGQRQRVAIGRAIVREPKVFLMDEPLSNLDAKLRESMRFEIKEIQREYGITVLYVTHDQTEAMTLGDRIVIMKDGFIQQIGTPQEVFNHPANLFVAGFIGTPQMNFFDAVLTRTGDKYTVTAYGTVFEPDEEKQAALLANNAQSGAVTLGVRPEHIMLCAPGAANSIKATVDVSEMMGSSIHLHTNVQGKDVVMVLATVDLPADHNTGFRYGEEVNFTFGGNVMHVFDSETGKALT